MLYLLSILIGSVFALTCMIPWLMPLAFIAEAPFIAILIKKCEEKAKLRKIYLLGFLNAVGFFVVSWYWFICTYPLEHLGLDKPQAVLMICVCWFGLTLMQGSTVAFVSFDFRLLYTSRKFAPLIFALLWMVFEFLMNQTFAGVPFNTVSLAVCEFLPFIQSASLFGAVFISFLIVLVNGYASLIILDIKENGFDKKRILKPLCAALSVIVLNSAVGLVLTGIDKSRDKEENAFSASVIQAGLTTSEKYFWTARESFESYMLVTHEALSVLETSPDFILWPETVINTYLLDNPSLLEEFKELASETGSIVLVGTLVYDYENDLDYNSVIAIYPDGSVEEEGYSKQKLVPFGEFTPLAGVLGKIIPIIEEIAVSDLTPGPGPQLLETDKGVIGRLICYDSIYPAISRESVKTGAEVLMLFTNDSWYGDSTEVTQHTRHAVLRAVENGRWCIRDANSGISALISPTGEVLDELGVNERGFLNVTAYTRNNTTLYTVIGDSAVLISALALIGFAVYKIYLIKSKKQNI